MKMRMRMRMDKCKVKIDLVPKCDVYLINVNTQEYVFTGRGGGYNS